MAIRKKFVKRSLFRVIVNLLMIILLLSYSLFSQDISDKPVRLYRMGDWISYKNCNYVTSLTEGIEYYYFGTSGGVIPYHKYARRWENPYTTSDGMAGDFVTAVYYDKTTNYLWAAHERGLSYLTPSAERWQNIENPTWYINRLGADDYFLWAQTAEGTYHRISRLGGGLQSPENQPPDNVKWAPCALDPLPNFKLYTINGDLQFDLRGVIFDRYFRQFPISLFFSDIAKDIYGGACGLGLIVGDDNIKRINMNPFGPLQNTITAMTISDVGIWMSEAVDNPNPMYERRGISYFNFSDWSWNYFETYLIPELVTDRVNDIAFANNRLWVGTDQGVVIYDTKKDRWKRIGMTKGLSDEMVTAITLEDTLAWIGTPQGMSLISIPSFSTHRVYLSPKKFTTNIYKMVANINKIWIGTDNGIYSVDKKGHNVSHFDILGERIGLDEPVAAQFNAIATSDSCVVFSRQNGLLKYFPKKDEWILLPNIPDLRDAVIYDLALDGEYLWIGTNNGAILMRLSDYYTEHYSTADGLAGAQVFRISVDGDWVWFATNKGLTKYHWRLYVSTNK